jgi:hypothetical protein
MIRSLVHPMAVAAVVFAAHVLSPAHAADPAFPPGSRIGLVPPPGMVASTAVNGFEDRERHALIAVSEYSAGVYAKVAQEFSLEQMRADGFVIASLEPAALQDAQGFVVAARQTVAGVAMRKWALVVHSAELTAMVVAQAPEAAQEAYPDATIRAALEIRSSSAPDCRSTSCSASCPTRSEISPDFASCRPIPTVWPC